MSNSRRPTYVTVAIIAVVIIATAAVILWFKPSNDINSASIKPSVSDNETNETVTTELAAGQVVKATTTPSQSQFVTGLENLPRSLKGTHIDGEIIIDENKQLVVTEVCDVCLIIFYQLGEEEEAVIFARVESYIRHHTPEPAASQAVTIFNQYVAYLKALPEIEKRYGNLQLQATKSGELDLNAVAQQKQDIANLRQQYFDKPTITAFFWRRG
ncbi:hypothetical protein [Psychrobacter sp. JCM 18900]|uniref:hypothetical protein n=1 Tax=Psychrobacter sp. JCM 18900 TaxID=1298608 RepID=UPI0004BC1A39|nr:hypothetical protein [Psychrobacter sp. JCM 18900]